jgi:hypothetical protein
VQEAHEVLHQHRFPLPRAADDDVGGVALDIQVDALQHVLGAEGLVQIADADVPPLVPLRGVLAGHHSPNGQITVKSWISG